MKIKLSFRITTLLATVALICIVAILLIPKAQRGNQFQVEGWIYLPVGKEIGPEDTLEVGVYGYDLAGILVGGSLETGLVNASRPDRTQGNHISLFWTPNNGWSYGIRDLPPGSYVVYLFHNDVFSFWDIARVGETNWSVRLDLELKEERFRPVEILVVDSTRNPVSGRQVDFLPADEHGYPILGQNNGFIDKLCFSSNERGKVEVPRLYMGRYLVWVPTEGNPETVHIVPSDEPAVRATVVVED